MVILITVSKDWMLRQVDVKNAFLNGEHEEEVFMEQSHGFIAQDQKHLVCKLEKSLYGLKQGPHALFDKFKGGLVTFSFTPTRGDISLFTRSHARHLLYVLVYVAT